MSNIIKFDSSIFFKSSDDNFIVNTSYENRIGIKSIDKKSGENSCVLILSDINLNNTNHNDKFYIKITSASTYGIINSLYINGIKYTNSENNNLSCTINNLDEIPDLEITNVSITILDSSVPADYRTWTITANVYNYKDNIPLNLPTIKIGGNVKYTPGTTTIGSGNDSLMYKISLGANKTTIVACTDTGNWRVISDKRDKTDFQPIESAYEFINSLTPLTYVMNQRYKYIDENGNFNEIDYNNKTKSSHRRQAGLLAQEVREKMLEIYKNDNYAQIVDIANYDYPNSDDDTYSMSYTSLVPFLIGAVNKNYEKLKKLEGDLNE